MKPIFGSRNPFAFMELQDVQQLANFFERRVSADQVAVAGEVAFHEDFSYGYIGIHSHCHYGLWGRVITGFSSKKLTGRMRKSCHMVGMTGQSSMRGT
jgi:hypothetical protein